VLNVTASTSCEHGSVTSERQPRGTGFTIRDPWPWPEFAGLVRLGETEGYRALFLPEIAGRDAFAALTAAAGETTDLLLGTGVVPMDARTPQVTAMGAATVHERSDGRAILGLGTGPAVPGALARLGSMVGALRTVFAGKAADLEGTRLGLSLPLEAPLPLWVSALGPRAVRLAGQIADGVLLNWCTPERVAEAVRAVRESAEAAGRDPSAVTIAVYVRANLSEDTDAAMAALQAAAGEYASYPAYARQFALMGLESEARAGAAAHKAGRHTDVPTALVHAIGVTGDVTAARGRVEAYRDAGADLPIVYTVVGPGDGSEVVTRTIRALAPGSSPA
jgi:alkanesulfonate monooxygenase SsuD/methylene tetrahydromethanopterin reductase-like flavin-dependent oxidoreductase (luciferase family)